MTKRWLNVIYILFIFQAYSFGGGVIQAPIPVVEPMPVKKMVIPVYLGMGLTAGKYFTSSYEDVTYGVMGRTGYEWNQYFGLEARYIETFWSEDGKHGEKLEHYGLFLKPMLPFNENYNLYALLGYGWSKTNRRGLLTKRIDDNGFSAGLGFEYDLSDKRDDYDPNIYYPEGFDGQADQEMGWGLFVDYQRLLIKSGVPDMDVISGGVTYDF